MNKMLLTAALAIMSTSATADATSTLLLEKSPVVIDMGVGAKICGPMTITNGAHAHGLPRGVRVLTLSAGACVKVWRVPHQLERLGPMSCKIMDGSFPEGVVMDCGARSP